ncbi:uncharacterized protein G2W53_003567 [Senna tora]|uniref:Uncharacterized protein n=1 Tax=Senna tora TaxID=362788 RepID=A0A834XAD6_9FABA|nr:uncharacterized protein G2W53_003567 [Senna tora]
MAFSIGYKRIEGRLGRGMLFGEVKTITNRMRQEERRRGNGLQDWVSRLPQLAFGNGEVGADLKHGRASGELLKVMQGVWDATMMTDGFTICIYQNAEVREESNGVAFRGNNFPIMTSLSRAIDFEGLMQVVHQTLRLQPFQWVSHLIYTMSYVSDGVRFFPCELMDDSRVNHMFFCHATCLPYLPIPVIEICAQITRVQQDSIGGDYIPDAPLQTVLSQEFLGSQPAADDDEYEGAIPEVEQLLSIPIAAPNDEIGDEEYEDQLMGKDIEDGDYEKEDPNDYEREDPYPYEEVNVGHVH